MKATGRIKVLHLISGLNTGGAEKTLFNLATSMDRSRFQNIIVSMKDLGILGKDLNRHGFTVMALGMIKGFPDPRGIVRLFEIISMLKPDLIQCWMYHANILGLFAGLSRPVLWNIRCSNMDLSKYGVTYRMSVKAGAWASKLPYCIVTNSKAGKTWHEGLGYKPRRWRVIPNGFDTSTYRPDNKARSRIRQMLGIPEDAFVIGHIARLDPMKDHSTFFKAAHMMSEVHDRVHFILAGRGISEDSPYIIQLARKMPRNTLHLLGERNDIPDILNALDVCTLASHGEGMPNVIGEAMSCAIPCVVTDIGDSASMVESTGIVVPPESSDALYQAWLKLFISGRETLKEMGMRARARVMRLFSIAGMVNSYEALYLEAHKHTNSSK